jgi:hypothetical protein
MCPCIVEYLKNLLIIVAFIDSAGGAVSIDRQSSVSALEVVGADGGGMACLITGDDCKQRG